MLDKKFRERCLRSIGIMDERQLEIIKNTRVAIGGLGLGGSVFINLVRLGFEKFHVADPDVYERTNINRQRAAKETTIDCRKDECLIQEARSINPDIEVIRFKDGVSEENVKEFLRDVDWVVDAVDVFAIPAKVALHEEATKKKLPIVTCVSVGFGAAIVVYDKNSPGFIELTGLSKDAPYATNIDRFVKAVAPEMPEYMREQIDKALKRTSHIPFVVPGVEISAALVSTEICKHILALGDRIMAPQGIYVDPVAGKYERFLADFRAREGTRLKRVA